MRKTIAVAGFSLLMFATIATAQQAGFAISKQDMRQESPDWLHEFLPDSDDPAAGEYAEQRRQRKQATAEMNKIRRRYFTSTRRTENIQLGLLQLEPYVADPAYYPLLLETFERSPSEIRQMVLGLLAEQATDEADATLAWTAVFDRDEDMRDAAADLLAARVEEVGASDRVKLVIAGGLKQDNNREVIEASGLARRFRLPEMIPLMILAQGAGDTRGRPSERTGNLGFIVIGRQVAFVSDLTPVVSDSAVAFDPTLSVVTEGVVLEIQDAVVLTYRVDVNNDLIALTTDLWGQRTDRFAWDGPAWAKWYEDEFTPFWQAKQAAAEGEG
ncbi:MAG: hypothetical protein AAF747_06175 [Planctomycetota bacterium]